MGLDIVKAAERAKVVPRCTCLTRTASLPLGATPDMTLLHGELDPDCPIHGAHFSDADVDDEPTE